jgi:hypothetical protein
MRGTDSALFACTGPHLADGCLHMRTPHPRAAASINLCKGRSLSAVTALTRSSGFGCTKLRRGEATYVVHVHFDKGQIDRECRQGSASPLANSPSTISIGFAPIQLAPSAANKNPG